MCRNLAKVVQWYKENQDCNSILFISPGTWPTPLILIYPSSEGLAGLMSMKVLVVTCSLTNSRALVCPCLDANSSREIRGFSLHHTWCPLKKEEKEKETATAKIFCCSTLMCWQLPSRQSYLYKEPEQN